MHKELTSAFVMTIILLIFAIPLQSLSGESRIMPELIVYFLACFTLGQYVFAINSIRQGSDIKLTLQNYPVMRVGILITLTIIYLSVLDYAGFYLASYVYFTIVSILGQPMKITKKGVVIRLGVCAICITLLYVLFTVLLSVQIPLGVFKF